MTLNSPFSQHIKSNYVPSDEDIPRIMAVVKEQQAIIDGITMEYNEVQEAIKELQRQGVKLRNKRKRHQDFAEAHKAMLSPVRNLPLDVLSRIFTLLTPARGDWEYELFGDRVQRYPVVSVSHVCRQWRALSIGTPLLWTLVAVGCYPGPQQPKHDVVLRTDSLLNLLTTFTSRTGECPMTLSLTATDPVQIATSPFAPAYTTSIVRLVDALLCFRWEHMWLDFVSCAASSPLLGLLHVPQHSREVLRTMQANVCSKEVLASVAQSCVLELDLADSPFLTSFHTDLPGSQLRSVNVRWNALTILTMGNRHGNRHFTFTVLDAYAIMARCPKLTKCTMNLYDPASASAPSVVLAYTFPRVVTLPYLESLLIFGTPAPHCFAESLRLPFLKKLSVLQDLPGANDAQLQHVGWPQEETNSVLLRFIHTSGAQITDLTFDYQSLSSTALQRCFEGVPNIRNLTIKGTTDNSPDRRLRRMSWVSAKMDKHVLHQLTPKFSSRDGFEEGLITPCLCPKLERLSCTLTAVDSNHSDWVDFLAGRRMVGLSGSSSVVRLDSACIKNISWSTVIQAKEIVDGLRERGVDEWGIEVIGNYGRYTGQDPNSFKRYAAAWGSDLQASVHQLRSFLASET